MPVTEVVRFLARHASEHVRMSKQPFFGNTLETARTDTVGTLLQTFERGENLWQEHGSFVMPMHRQESYPIDRLPGHAQLVREMTLSAGKKIFFERHFLLLIKNCL